MIDYQFGISTELQNGFGYSDYFGGWTYNPLFQTGVPFLILAKIILNIDSNLDYHLSRLAAAGGISKCEMIRVCICNTIADWMHENEKVDNDATVAAFSEHDGANFSG